MRAIILFIVLCLISLVLAGGLSLPPVLAQDLNRVGLVVQFADGDVQTQCIEFSETTITGYQVLERSDFEFETEFSAMGAAICKIEGTGCPAENCFCYPTDYWAYWSLKDGKWVYSQIGASVHNVYDGDVEGWRWGGGIAPEETPSIDEICGETAATATASPTATKTATRTPTATPTDTPIPTRTPTNMPTNTRSPASNNARSAGSNSSNASSYTDIATATNPPAGGIPTATSLSIPPTATSPATIPTTDMVPSATWTEAPDPITEGSTTEIALLDQAALIVSPTPEIKLVEPMPTATEEQHAFRKSREQAENPAAQAPTPTATPFAAGERNLSKLALLAGGALGYLVFLFLFGGLSLGLVLLVVTRRR